MFKDKEKKHHNSFLLKIFFQIACVIILFLCCIKNIKYLDVLYVVPDEFGYWSSASFFLGYDWSDVAQFNSYYSFGYGFVLSFFLKCFSGVNLYKSAIIFNAVLLCGIFFILKEIGDKIYGNKDINTLISFMLCFYASNIAYVQTSTSEIFLYFVYCLLILIWVYILERPSAIKCVQFGSLLALLYCIHLRSIGIVVVSVIGMFFLFWKRKITLKQITLFAFALIGLFVISIILKKSISQELYADSVSLAQNTYSGQTWKIRQLFRENGIKNFAIKLVGHLWYLGTSTFLIIYISIVIIVKRLMVSTRQKGVQEGDVKSWKKLLYETMVMSNFIVALLIGALFMITAERIDTFIYGRYVEFTILPLLFVGLHSLYINADKYKIAFLLVTLYIFFSVIINSIYVQGGYKEIVYTNVTALFKWIWKHENNFVMPCCLWTVFMFTIIIFLCHLKKYFKVRIWIVALMIIVNWYKNGNAFIQESGIPYQEKNEVINIADYIENKEELPVYYVYDVNDKDYDIRRIFVLQFLLKDISIHTIESDKLYEIPEESHYIVANRNSKFLESVEKQCTKILEGYPLILYQY